MRYTTLIIQLLFAINISAQLTISGQIVDGVDGSPLTNAHIILLDNPTIGTTSSMDGQFEISLSNNYSKGDLLIQFLGYEEVLVPYDVSINNFLKVELLRNVQQIEEVTVVASRSVGEEFVVEELSKMDVYTNPNSRADPIRAVNSLAYSTTTDETANLSLRGSPSSETGFILNNVPIDDAFKLDQSNGVGQFSIFNTSIIKKIDVFPSNPPIEFGASSSGLIALYTDDFDGTNSQSINLTLAGIGVNVNRKINARHSLVAYANIGIQHGLKWLNPNAFKQINKFNSADAGLYWIAQLNDKSKIKVFNYSLKENYSYQLNLPSANGPALQKKGRSLTIINYESKLSDQLSLDLNQGINFTKASYGFGNIDHGVDKTDLYTSFNLSYFSSKSSVKLGGAFDQHNFNNQGQYSTYFWANDISHPFESYELKESIRNPEVYLYYKYLMSDKLSLGLGARNNIWPSANINSYQSYQVNINYQVNDHSKVTTSIGKYNRLLLPGEEVATPTLVSSNHMSLDYELTSGAFSTKAAIYKKHTTYPDNSLDIYGAELYVSYDTDKLSTSISGAHISSKFNSEGISYPSDHDIGIFIRHLLKYKVSSVVELNSSLLHRSGKYYVPVQGSVLHNPTMTYEPIFLSQQDGSRLPSYTLWDMSISHVSEFGNGALLTFISCSNVIDIANVSGIRYNEQYKPIGNEYFGPRVMFFGIIYNWN